MWIFGYGSLIWKIDFPYKRRTVGYIEGYVRRFWQGSEDHRGVPGAYLTHFSEAASGYLTVSVLKQPGRVVTIVPSSNPKDRVYGIAFEIAEKDVQSVIEYLNYREKDGYDQKVVTFHPIKEDVEPFELSIYIGDTDNPFYLGPASLDEIALQIYKSEGPSGRNDEYLFNLAETMRTLVPNVEDAHLFQLEKLVKKLKAGNSKEENCIE